MNLNKTEAKTILRLPAESSLDARTLENAFHKMIRRYPIEQFPEKFTQIRNAYEFLTDPSEAIRSLLFADSFDLSSILESYEPMNAKPQGTSERFIFESLAALLKLHFDEIISDDSDEGLNDAFSRLPDDQDKLQRIIELMMGETFGGPAGKKRR